jgi:hypothetical protein
VLIGPPNSFHKLRILKHCINLDIDVQIDLCARTAACRRTIRALLAFFAPKWEFRVAIPTYSTKTKQKER